MFFTTFPTCLITHAIMLLSKQIGEVDLIVNFDVMKSPIRSIQRNGRTGRKRDGRVVFLIADHEEKK